MMYGDSGLIPKESAVFFAMYEHQEISDNNMLSDIFSPFLENRKS